MGRGKRSIDASGHDNEVANPAKRKSISHMDLSYNEKNSNIDDDLSNLIDKLKITVENILTRGNLPPAIELELKGVDWNMTTLDEFIGKRDEIRKLLDDPDKFDYKMQINYSTATLAGALIESDNHITTRSKKKTMVEQYKVDENELLYSGIDEQCNEKSLQMIKEKREAKIVESFLDFQKQLNFKMNLMDHVKAKNSVPKIGSFSEGKKCTRRQVAKRDKELKQEAEELRQKCMKNRNLFKTPKRKANLNPLDLHAINNNYASAIASELRNETKKKRHSIIPIYFNKELFDEPDSDDENKDKKENVSN